jgi:hypothetical protein
MSGNKGAVAIRLEYHDTSFCFISAHLAAGHANVEERNTDYRTIVNDLQFLRGKTISSHQYKFYSAYIDMNSTTHSIRHRNVIWLADTNYRIDLDNDTVRALVRIGDLETLLEADQVYPSCLSVYQSRYLA